MGGSSRSSGPSREQQEISSEQLRLQEEALELQRQSVEAERRQLESFANQVNQQTISNEALLSELREQNVRASETTSQFSSLLRSAVGLQQTQAGLQAQETTRAESRQDLAARNVSTSLLSTQRDVAERNVEARRRRALGASAPVLSARERTASLLQR